MDKRIRLYIFPLILISTLIVSLFSTTAVQADDTTPPPAATEPAATNVPDLTQEPAATAEETPANIPTATDEPVNAISTEPQTLTVPEVLDQLPEGTDLVILDQNGGPVPLATQNAENILLTGDPMWCPTGVLPGGAGCTVAHTSFNDLINDLENSFTGPNFTYSGSGTIYVSYDYDTSLTNDNGAAIVFDYGNLGLTSLVVQGGWNFGTNTKVGTSTIDGADRVEFLDWGWWGEPGNLTLNDLSINQGSWLYIGDDTGTTTADVTLDHVTVSNTTFGSYIGTEGDVKVTDSQFTTNAADGLDVDSGGKVSITRVTADNNNGNGLGISTVGGNISLTNVIAEYNNNDGAYLDICGCTTGNIIITGGSFNNNQGNGLEALAHNNITLKDVTADYNRWAGAYLGTDGNILVDGNSFSHNHTDGLDVESYGNVTLKNIIAVDNAYDGAYVSNGSGNVNVSQSTFQYNGWGGEGGGGLNIYTDGKISIGFIAANNNYFNGAYLDPSSITAVCSSFNDNGDTGLNVDLAGGTGVFKNITATGNSVDTNIVNGSYTVSTTDCSGSSNTGSVSPSTGSGCVGETIVLSNEDRLIFQCAEAGNNQEEVLTLNDLPGPLPASYAFISGFTVHLIFNGVEIFVSPDPQVLQFKLPEGANSEDYAILFWNGTDWVEVSGAIVANGFLQVSVVQEGTYILAHK